MSPVGLLRLALVAPAAAAVLLTAGCSGAIATSTPAVTAEGSAPLDTAATLQQVSGAIRRYQYVAEALAAGYGFAGSCQSTPAGGTGAHYINPTLASQPPDPARPAGLIYVPRNATLVLAGAEYVRTAEPLARPPHLYGRTFDGPLPAHRPGDPPRYVLHVWSEIPNPLGPFAGTNPDAGC